MARCLAIPKNCEICGKEPATLCRVTSISIVWFICSKCWTDNGFSETVKKAYLLEKSE